MISAAAADAADAAAVTEDAAVATTAVTATKAASGMLPSDLDSDRSRAERIEALYRRHGARGARSRRSARFLWKRYAWRLTFGAAEIVKRATDILLSGIALLLLSPVFAIIALLIKSKDNGPVLFWQARVGLYGKEFPFPKFRSMVVNAEKLKDTLLAQNDHAVSAGGGAAAEQVTFKMKNDPRVTPVGRVLRKYSLDELPQLWCVLKGDMSLVGPRPPVPREVARYTLRDRRRLEVKPGLTCIWQVSGRGEIPFPEQVALDVRYIESRSFWLDIKLLLQTVPAVLFGKGAY